jgi:hypothetical protein
MARFVAMPEYRQDPEGSQNNDCVLRQQLKAMSENLLVLIRRLEQQRDKSTSKVEKKHLERLLKEARKQAASIAKLQASIANTVSIMAKSAQALEDPEWINEFSQDDDRTAAKDAYELLFHLVTAPFQKQHRHVKVRPSMDLGESLKAWRSRKNLVPEPVLEEHEPLPETASTPELSSATSSLRSDSVQADPRIPDETVEQDPSSTEEPTLSPVSESESQYESRFAIWRKPRSEIYELDSSPCCSQATTPRIAAMDWECINSPEGWAMAPPLPRKSSRRRSHTPKVPCRIPSRSLPPTSRLPPVPLTPPPSVPEVANPLGESAPEQKDRSSEEELLNHLEKRYSLTLPTPPETP